MAFYSLLVNNARHPMNNPGGPPFQGAPHPYPHAPPPHAFRPMPPPPANWLPPGWTEHKAPDGMPYYYNAASGTSSWVKPTLAPPGPPGMGPPGMGPPGMTPPFAPPPHMMQGPPPPGVANYHQPQLYPPGVAPPEPSIRAQDSSTSKGKKTKKAKKEKAVKKYSSRKRHRCTTTHLCVLFDGSNILPYTSSSEPNQ